MRKYARHMGTCRFPRAHATRHIVLLSPTFLLALLTDWLVFGCCPFLFWLQISPVWRLLTSNFKTLDSETTARRHLDKMI